MALDWSRAKKHKRSKGLEQDNADFSSDAAARWLRQAEGESRKIRTTKKKRQKRAKRKDRGANPAVNTVGQGRIIYADGSCEPNPGKGGWGFAVYQDGREIHSASGGEGRSTNNIMELTALLRAVEWASENARGATIFTDSRYAERGCNSWRFAWKNNNWRLSPKNGSKPVKNVELWQDIDLALKGAALTIAWCKGHAGNVGNERADRLASVGRRSINETVVGMRTA